MPPQFLRCHSERMRPASSEPACRRQGICFFCLQLRIDLQIHLRKGIVSNLIEDLQTRFDELKKRIDLVRSYL